MDGNSPLREPLIVRLLLIGAALAYLLVMLVAPLIAVLVQAFADGVGAWWGAIIEPDAVSAIK